MRILIHIFSSFPNELCGCLLLPASVWGRCPWDPVLASAGRVCTRVCSSERPKSGIRCYYWAVLFPHMFINHFVFVTSFTGCEVCLTVCASSLKIMSCLCIVYTFFQFVKLAPGADTDREAPHLRSGVGPARRLLPHSSGPVTVPGQELKRLSLLFLLKLAFLQGV